MTAERIFGCSHAFVGRESELERIISASHAGSNISILTSPGVGASELLKQAYDELFCSESVIPFYFELDRSDRDAETAARRFAYEFLTQTVAYLRQDPGIIHTQPTLEELSRLSPPEHAVWIDGAIEAISHRGLTVGTLTGIPARADRRVCVLFDNIDRVRLIRDGGGLLKSIEKLGMSRVSVVSSGLQRAMYGRLPFPQMLLSHLEADEAQALVTSMTQDQELDSPDAVRDLIAVKMGGCPAAIKLFTDQARTEQRSITDFRSVVHAYTDSIFGGLLSRDMKKRILRPLPASIDQDRVIRLLCETLSSAAKRLPMRHWRRTMRDADDLSFGKLIRHLHVEEIISAGDGTVNMGETSLIARDYIQARSEILAAPEKRAAIIGRAMQSYLARASRLMTEAYRSRASIGIRELLTSFDGRVVPAAAINYGLFKKDLKGRDNAEVVAALARSTAEFELPNILYTARTSAYYPAIAELLDHGRSAVGLTTSGDAWLAAEIDSKLEADRVTAEFWCDRLEMAAVYSGLDKFRIWLIAPEGFTDEALQMMATRKTLGSSRKQVHLLREILSNALEPAAIAATAYESTIPMDEGGEMEAVRLLGDIAATHSIPAKPASQIKTALVEALINAAEHSLSPDQTVNLSFAVTTDTIAITIQNRGLKLTEHMLAQADLNSERRGWGLELIRRFMDTVHIEPTDDGTRMVMTKRFAEPAEMRD